MTRDEIIRRMLSRIDPKYDTSVGSFFYDAVAPIGIELEQVYLAQGKLLDEYLADTATGDNLTRKAAELGVIRKPAVKASTTVVIAGTQGAVISQGDLVASEANVYLVTQGAVIGPSGQANVPVTAEVAGARANVPVGAIRFFPVTLPGLTAVTNPQAVTNGLDEESDDDLRERYFERVQQPATSGNAAHYKQWAKSVVGIGDAKVFPLWDGPGTVKICLLDVSKKPPTQELVDQVEAYIESVRPVGAEVAVVAATAVNINLSATLTLAPGYAVDQVKPFVELGLDEYLREVAFVDSAVRYTYISTVLLNVEGIVDFQNLLVNGGAANVPIATDQVAVRGVINLV